MSLFLYSPSCHNILTISNLDEIIDDRIARCPLMKGKSSGRGINLTIPDSLTRLSKDIVSIEARLQSLEKINNSNTKEEKINQETLTIEEILAKKDIEIKQLKEKIQFLENAEKITQY